MYHQTCISPSEPSNTHPRYARFQTAEKAKTKLTARTQKLPYGNKKY